VFQLYGGGAEKGVNKVLEIQIKENLNEQGTEILKLKNFSKN